MFPEQISAGLAPWQAKKLYLGNIATSEGSTLALDTSVVDPASPPSKPKTGLPGTPNGMSYQQFAMQGLRHQLSQGAADFTMRTGLHYYKLVDSALATPQAQTMPRGMAHRPLPQEQDFFDGIDTSLPALAERLGSEQTKLPELKQQLAEIAAFIAEADKLADRGPEMSLPPLLKGYELLRAAMASVRPPGSRPRPSRMSSRILRPRRSSSSARSSWQVMS